MPIAIVSLLIVFCAMLALSLPVRAESHAVEVLSLETGRFVYGIWWNIGSFARTDSFDINLTLKNGFQVPIEAQIIISVVDEASYPIAYLQKPAAIPENTMCSLVLGSISISNWARIGQACVYLNLICPNGTVLCPETTVNFDILPPIYYTLSLKTYDLSGVSIKGAIYVDGRRHKCPENVTLLQGTHILQAEPIFYELDTNGLVSRYVFRRWDDASINIVRGMRLFSKATIVGVYGGSRTKLQPL
jgi:hypothetical protein